MLTQPTAIKHQEISHSCLLNLGKSNAAFQHHRRPWNGRLTSHTLTLVLSNHMLKSYIKYSSCTLLPCESAVPNFLLEPSKQETSPAGSLTYHRSLINFIFNCLLSQYLITPKWLSWRYSFTAPLPSHYESGNIRHSWGQRHEGNRYFQA